VRYYVLCTSEHAGIRPHIVAEVVRAALDGEDREVTLAAALAGDHAAIMTRTELVKTAAGIEAIAAWESGDDGQYDDESDAIVAAGDPVPLVRLIATGHLRRGAGPRTKPASHLRLVDSAPSKDDSE
jgi:hypothetical protein